MFYYNRGAMFLLPTRLRQILENKKGKKTYAIPLDTELIPALRITTQEQDHPEEDVLVDWVNSGVLHSVKDASVETEWESLTEREQETLALVCLGRRNYEIAGMLGITHETVKTHLQHIFRKFRMRSKKELRLLLQNWDFADWWMSHQI